ncbi:MAG: hypothetical protein NZ583_06310 [Desulfobacterota bacterium]|nr:hypothetical protein [Thermodesulfobacteriota bacterium]MDW8002510.1 hypothetical protein [Deltaproteobacteria bacterium]
MVLRNIFHTSGSLIPFSYIFFGRDFAFVLSLMAFVTISIFELFRIKGGIKVRIVERLLKTKESKRPTGSFYFLLASIFVILLFESEAAILSLFVLSFCDPLAASFGRRFGKKRWRGKSLEGSMVFFLASLLFLFFAKVDIESCILVSLVSTLTEFFSTRLDDNFTIPLSTAFALQFFSF